MQLSEIIHTQKKVGTPADGFWGPKSIAACQKYLKSLMPSPHPFPVEGSREFIDFYGAAGQKSGYAPPTKKVALPFSVYYLNITVNFLWPHEKCANSLKRVFERLAEVYPTTESRQRSGLLTYNGLYNPRKKLGSRSSMSMHSWAVAIDINAGKNGNKTAWPVRATMPIEIMECFAQEGWLSAGAFWGRDAMHMQATAPPNPE